MGIKMFLLLMMSTLAAYNRDNECVELRDEGKQSGIYYITRVQNANGNGIFCQTGAGSEFQTSLHYKRCVQQINYKGEENWFYSKTANLERHDLIHWTLTTGSALKTLTGFTLLNINHVKLTRCPITPILADPHSNDKTIYQCPEGYHLKQGSGDYEDYLELTRGEALNFCKEEHCQILSMNLDDDMTVRIYKYDRDEKRGKLVNLPRWKSCVKRNPLILEKYILMDEQGSGVIFKEIKGLSNQIIVTILNNSNVIGYAYGSYRKCDPFWGKGKALEAKGGSNIGCNLLNQLLDVRQTVLILFILMFFFRTFTDAFVRNDFINEHMEEWKQKYIMKMKHVFNGNSWAGNCNPLRIWMRIRFIFTIKLIEILIEYFIFGLWSSTFTTAGKFSFSFIYTIATIPDIISTVLDGVKEYAETTKVSPEKKRRPRKKKKIRDTDRQQDTKQKRKKINGITWFQKNILWWGIRPVEWIYYCLVGMPADWIMKNVYMVEVYTTNDFKNLDTIWNDERMQTLTIDCQSCKTFRKSIRTVFSSSGWMKPSLQILEDLYTIIPCLGPLIDLTYHSTNWYLPIFAGFVNIFYVARKDKERSWALKYHIQLLLGVTFGAVSFIGIEDEWKTAIQLNYNGILTRCFFGILWFKNLFFHNTEQFYGENLFGEGFLSSIFVDQIHVASLLMTLKDYVIMMLILPSMLGLWNDKGNEPLYRLKKYIYSGRTGIRYWKRYLSFYAVLSAVSAIIYTVYLRCTPSQLNSSFGEHLSTFNYDWLIFIQAVRVVSLLIAPLGKKLIPDPPNRYDAINNNLLN